jgi:hypothetical protein
MLVVCDVLVPGLAQFSTMKNVGIRSSETSGNLQRTTRLNLPEGNIHSNYLTFRVTFCLSAAVDVALLYICTNSF